MNKFDYLEDYIEYMSGYRKVGNFPTFDFWNQHSSPLKLANYDKGVVASLGAQSSLDDIPYTDRQELLARKLCVTYARQLRKLGIEPPPPDIACKNGSRVVNRDKIATIDGDEISIHFPFDSNKIDKIRRLAKESEGRLFWDKPKTRWVAGLTENNLTNIVNFCVENEVEVSAELVVLAESIKRERENKFVIQLVRTPTGLTIENAPQELIDYVETTLGGFGDENFYNLVDNAANLGITLSQDIIQELLKEFSKYLVSYLSKRDSTTSTELFGSISDELGLMAWKKKVNKGPIVIYDPVEMFKDKYKTLAGYKVQFITKFETIDPNADILYTTDVINTAIPSPWTLITCFSMMYNPPRSVWLTDAHRVIRISDI